MKNFFSLFCLMLLTFSLNSQIETGKSGTKKKRKTTVQDKNTGTGKTDKTVVPKEDYTLLSLGYSYGSSFRSLKENGDFYGEPLGERGQEKRLPVSGVYLGANTKFDQKIHLDFGIGFQQYGEQYQNSGSDTTISYKTTYSHVVLPLKVQYQTGDKIIFFIGTGLQAQLLAAYLNKTSTTIEGNETTVKVTELKNKNPFSIASVSSAGVQLPLGNRASFLVSADYALQLSNTFNKQAPYIHRSNLFAIKAAIGFKL
ncbi:MAG: hypothetical protein K0R65_1380 [Crocinitomicaceae bacterium]|nr:hypothetical protein [Crocinitomicaceae bacterium]